MLKEVLDRFETVSLKELNERAELLNREDMKFVFPVCKLLQVLRDCVGNYNLLAIENNVVFNYRTWYYDTGGLRFYHQHHAGKGNRCKIRRRLYINNGISFLEVKHKTNKGNTVKYRTGWDSLQASASFVKEHSGYDCAGLQETIEINYDRITLLHKTKAEKVTIDINLRYSKNENVSDYNNIVIAEVKTESSTATSFYNCMKQHGIREGSLSKYCLGLISINRNIKHNNFKQLYQKILKTNLHGIVYQL